MQVREFVFVTMQLTAQQIESFEQDGDLFFPKAFSAEETGVAHRDFTPIEPLADDTLRELIA